MTGTVDSKPADWFLLAGIPDDKVSVEAACCNKVVLNTQGADDHPPQPGGKTPAGAPR